jgi:hypothetical protein
MNLVDQVIQHPNRITAFYQGPAQMAPDKAGAAGNQ